MILREELEDAITFASQVYLSGGLCSHVDEKKSERAATVFRSNLKAFLGEIDGSASVAEIREVLEEIAEDEKDEPA